MYTYCFLGFNFSLRLACGKPPPSSDGGEVIVKSEEVIAWLPLMRELLSVCETEGESSFNKRRKCAFLSLRLACGKPPPSSDGGEI